MAHSSDHPPPDQIRSIRLPPLGNEGFLGWPGGPAAGLVLFAHGSGSGRFSPRNSHVARGLRAAGIATLLFDLLSEAEEAEGRSRVFDIPLLADRLIAAVDGARQVVEALADLPLGFFGASTGAGAALAAAARLGDRVSAIVSRGGRPDLAGDALPDVTAPTLLVVGGADPEVLALNRGAQERLRCPSRLVVVPGATHLFEEPGALDTVVDLARKWFLDHFLAVGRGEPEGIPGG
jgi:pimeloyl-ACP methyl ester carboxylesterase